MTLTLPIAHTWDGAAIPDRAVVQLAETPEGLLLRSWSPWRGDPAPSGAPGPTDRLWEHEVVELFLIGPGLAYLEVEVGAYGHHLVLDLADVRSPRRTHLPLDLAVRRFGADAFAAEATLPAAWLPAKPWRANAYRIHGPPDGRRYLAHAPLPGPAPDFHQPHRFPTVTVGPSESLADDVRAAVLALRAWPVRVELVDDDWAASVHVSLIATDNATRPNVD
jgi:hypothetical protein